MVARGVRLLTWLAAALTACALDPLGNAHAADRPKRVLALFSTGRGAQFAVVAERNLPSLLYHGLNGGVDFSSEYLDPPMFSSPTYLDAYCNYLDLKYQSRVDLVIAVGRFAIEFLAVNRAVLLPSTPVVFYDIEPPRRRMPNSTGLVNELHFKRSLDLAVALQPDLKHVYVVSGAGVSDRANERRARSEFLPLTRRLEFTYLSGLVTADLETRLRRLPRHSAVFVVLVTKDGAGEIVQQMDYVSRIAAVASAPTYSWVDAAVDVGIVGGSRRDQLAEMKAVAELALRVLRGERADDILVASPILDVDQVDWRQLRRWGISESRVPARATVLFREPGMWESNQSYIVGAVMLMLAQTALIAGLLVQRTKRRRVEFELRGSETKLRVSYDQIRQLSRRLLGEQEAERARIARELHDDNNQQLAILSIELDQLGSLQVHAKRVSRALQTAQGIATSVRELSHRLHPSRLQLVGLVTSLDGLRSDFASPHLSITFRHQDVPMEIDHEIALCLFRVAQEALGNTLKHSEADHVWIELTGNPTGVALTIADDGKGFDVDGIANTGLGLISMRERVESVGGVLEIHASPASGTRLKVTVPTHLPESAFAGVTSA